MTKFIKLHNQKKELVYINVEQITCIQPDNYQNDAITMVTFINGFVEVYETPEEVLEQICSCNGRGLRGE